MAKACGTAQAEEEGEPARQGREHLHRLQGHRAAAQVHLRSRQDPRSSGDRPAPSSSGRSPARSRTPARWRCCRTPPPPAERRHEMKIILTRKCRASAPPATSSRSRTASAVTTCCRRASRSRWTKGAEKQVAIDQAGPRGPRDPRPRPRQRGQAGAGGPQGQPPARRRRHRLFGSVTPAEIVDAVRAAGGPILDRRSIDTGGHIKTVGSHPVSVKLHPEVTASLTVTVTGG